MLGRRFLTKLNLQNKKTLGAPISQVLRLCHNSQHTPEHDKVYELRCYQVPMKDLKKYNELSLDGMKIRTKYSDLLGYWQSEYGGLWNQYIHLWEYDSLNHRIEARKRLAADPNWVSEYISQVLPMWDFQENSLLKLLPWAKLAGKVPDGGIYQLEKLSISGDVEENMSKIADYGLATDEGNNRILLGAWKVIAGKVNTVYLLHRYGSQDAAIHHCTQDKSKSAQAYKSMLPLTSSVESRILLPTPWSPWK